MFTPNSDRLKEAKMENEARSSFAEMALEDRTSEDAIQNEEEAQPKTWRLDRNFTFVHIPKSGGTSVRKYMETFFHAEDIFNANFLFNYPEYHSLGAEGPYYFVSHVGYNFVRAAGGYSMTILRNPVDRILSLYSYWKNPGKGRAPGPPLPEGMDLEQFLNSEIPYIWMNINNAQTWQLAFCHDFNTRRRFRQIKSYELLDIALKNLYDIDIVGISEEMDLIEQQVSYFFWKKGEIKSQSTVGNRNVSVERIQRESISEETINLIKEKTSIDFILYEEAKKIAREKVESIEESG